MNITRYYINCKYYWLYGEVEVAIFTVLECNSVFLKKR